jgi:hypothetical protein
MSKQAWCNFCGADQPLHYSWCHIGQVESDRRKEQLRLSPPPTSQTAHNPSTSLVPPQELPGDFLTKFSSQEHSSQRGGFQRTQAEVESERGERRMLVVVEWNGEQPFYAAAKLVEVLVQPDGSYVVCDERPLSQVGPSIPRKESADPLRREPYGVVIGFKMDPLERLDKVDASVGYTAWAVWHPRDKKGLI